MNFINKHKHIKKYNKSEKVSTYFYSYFYFNILSKRRYGD